MLALVLSFLLTMPSTFGYEAKVDFNTIIVASRPGGNVEEHFAEARGWLRHNVKVRVVGNQYSAAAMQILWYHVHKGRVCSRPSAMLVFHQPYMIIPILGVRVGDPDWHKRFAFWFGERNTAIIGPVTVEDWSPVHPSKFGIPQC